MKSKWNPKSGQKLRQNLREMFNLNSLDKKFVDYLLGRTANEACSIFLALDKKATSDNDAGKHFKARIEARIGWRWDDTPSEEMQGQVERPCFCGSQPEHCLILRVQ